MILVLIIYIQISSPIAASIAFRFAPVSKSIKRGKTTCEYNISSIAVKTQILFESPDFSQIL